MNEKKKNHFRIKMQKIDTGSIKYFEQQHILHLCKPQRAEILQLPNIISKHVNLLNTWKRLSDNSNECKAQNYVYKIILSV